MAANGAWTFTTGGYPSSLQQTNLPSPTGAPGPKEIHVRVKAAALNPVDIQIMNLPLWPYLPTFMAPNTKGIAKDFAGIVEAAGADTEWKKGDEIFGLMMTIVTGTLQEIAVVDTTTAAIAPKPSSWSWTQAAALPLVWLTARTTVASVEQFVTSHKKLVVLGGSSSTGMYAVHQAKARGWHVLASCSGRNADFVRDMGAAEIIDYTQQDVAARVREFQPEAIIDCVGGTDCIGLAPRYVTIVGDKTSRLSMGGAAIYLTHPRMVLRHFMGYLGFVQSYACVNLELRKNWLEETLSLPLDKIKIDSEFGFAQVREAYERLNTGRARGKVVVKVDSGVPLPSSQGTTLFS